MANSTEEVIPTAAIRKLVIGGSGKAGIVPAGVDGALAKWRRHYGEPKGLSGKSSFASVSTDPQFSMSAVNDAQNVGILTLRTTSEILIPYTSDYIAIVLSRIKQIPALLAHMAYLIGSIKIVLSNSVLLLPN